MSNVEQVKRILPSLNSRFTTREAHQFTVGLTVEQVGKALKGIKYVTALGNGRFHVKGRKVTR